jgi:transposase
VLPYADTAAMNAHLAEIARTVAPGAHAVIVLDGAGWHGGKDLVVPDAISLLTLPPYAPELNPVENVWQYLRANWLAISVFDGYDAIVTACCAAWNRFADARRSRFHHLSRMGTGQSVGPLV